MVKHTPGPWEWVRCKPNGTDGPWQCFLQSPPNECNDTMVTAMREDLAAFPYAATSPNARLIAAAPDLLAALQQIVYDEETTDSRNPEHPSITAAREAIAKATGE